MSQVINGDCLEEMKKLPINSIDTVITDPPYGLEFMGKGWDKGVPGAEYWTEVLRVAKPGAMLLAFGGTRTYLRLAAAIEDAGWELRDCMMWLYGSGFPKSLDISKAIDNKAFGGNQKSQPSNRTEVTLVDKGTDAGRTTLNNYAGTAHVSKPATDLAREWNGWGTALKPAWEPIIVAMKPLDGTFAENAEKWGVAGINVDGGRIGYASEEDKRHNLDGLTRFNSTSGNSGTFMASDKIKPNLEGTAKGRWPANLLLDEEAAVALDTQTSANVSRFFYTAKASKSERGETNIHPTVKPIKLMEYLCTITKTPTGGVVLDPFAGSGTTGVAAQNTGREFVLIEKEPKYYEICQSRLLPD